MPAAALEPDRDCQLAAVHARSSCAGLEEVCCTSADKQSCASEAFNPDMGRGYLDLARHAQPVSILSKMSWAVPKGGGFATASSYSLTWTEIAWSRPTMLGQSAHALKKRYTSSPPLALPSRGPSATCISTLQRHRSTPVNNMAEEKRRSMYKMHLQHSAAPAGSARSYLIAERSQMFAA